MNIVGEYMKKTKIIATIGPNSCSKEVLREFILNGLDVVRINLSHATYDFCIKVFKTIDELNNELNTNIATLLDTKGPDIRTHKFIGGHAFLAKSSKIRIYMDEIMGDSTKFSINYPNLINDVLIGNELKVNDGLITLKIINKGSNYLLCEVIEEGIISDYKSVNAPGTSLHRPFLSEKDKEDIIFATQHHVDFLALSFASTREDILEVNDLLINSGNDHTKLIAKIESETGVEDIEEIIKVSDGIMIARGDLGVELPMEEVPSIQKKLVNLCHKEGKISIVATEMLSSMENFSRPTRAEVSDVANAVLESVDAVMLSGETTVGKYPLESLIMMRKIIEETEKNIDYSALLKSISNDKEDITSIIAYNVAESANKLSCEAIIAPTITGYTAKCVSQFRPICPIVAVSPNKNTVKSLMLCYGVIPILTKELNSLDRIMEDSTNAAKMVLPLKEKDKVIITGGYPFKNTKHTNFLKIEEIKE